MILFLNAIKQVFLPKKQKQNTLPKNHNTYFLKNHKQNGFAFAFMLRNLTHPTK